MGITPKVSVIIPVYNTEKYLRQCLDSVVNQTLKDIEIICVDDGSTDGSLDILREYESKDSRVKVLTQNNLFAGVARNTGMKYATGKYYVFLDSDDFFEPNLLKLQYEKCEKYNADIGLCAVDRFDQSTGKYLNSDWMLTKSYIGSQPFNRETLGNKLFSITIPNPWNKIFLADFVHKHHLQFQPLPRANDVFFTMVAMGLANTIVAVDRVLVHYRIGMTTNLQANNSLSPLAFCEALSAVKHRLVEENIWHQVRLGFTRNVISQIVYTLNKLRTNPTSYDKLIKALNDRYLNEFEIDFDNPDPFYQSNFFFELKEIIEDYQSNSKPEPYYVKNGARYISNEIKPKVSVIVPVYNVELYLKECLESIVNQTLKDIEIILVDDGSSDDSFQIMQEYANHDDRITVIQQNNRGVSAARNIGLHYAKGEFIYFIDSDDYLELTALAELYPKCVENNLDALIFDYTRFCDDPNIKVQQLERPDYTEIYDGFSLLSLQKNDKSYSPVVWAIFLKNEFLNKNNISFYEGIIHEDNLFLFYVYMNATRMAHLKKCLYNHRLHPNSIMTSPESSKNVEGYFICMQEMLCYGLQKVSSNKKQQVIWRSMINMLNHAKRIYNQLPQNERAKIIFRNIFTQFLFEEFVLSQTNFTYETYNANSRTLQNKFNLQQKRIQLLQDEISAIHSSATYKIGRIITWPPRKIRGLVRCFKEHGLDYTWNRILIHLHLKPDDEKTVFTSPASNNLPQKVKGNSIVRNYDYYSHLDPSQYADELKLWYKRVTKEDLDLDNPQTFNEKIQWSKLYDSTPLKTRLSDKYLVREWVEKKIGAQYLIPLLGVWDKFDEIDFDKLPDQFVLKANHGCGWNIIVKDKLKFDIEDARSKFSEWMKTNFAFKWGLELQYLNIPPKIIAEEYLENGNNDLYDYKVFCFNGKAESIMFLSERKTGLKMAFYDLNWNKLPFTYSFPRNEENIPKPKNLDLLIELAETLAEGFAHVRVDFYILNDGSIKFGEMTFTSAGGTCKWNPPEQNRIYGDLIKLPPKSPIPERKVW